MKKIEKNQLFAVIITFIFLILSIVFFVHLFNTKKRPIAIFSIQHINNTVDIHNNIVKQPLIEGSLENYNIAKIRLLDYNTGSNTYISIPIKKTVHYKRTICITLKQCKKESKTILNPLNIALVSVKKGNKIIYEGWLFSQNTAFSLPKINNKFIYLISCNNKSHG